MVWLLPLAQSILSAQQKKKAEEEARRKAQADISSQRASSLGYPSYGYEAAQVNKQLEDEYGRRNYLAALLPKLMNSGQDADQDEDRDRGYDPYASRY